MIDDDIILGVRAAREEYARSHGFNIRAMIADLQARNVAGDQLVVRRPARRVEEALQPQEVGLSNQGTQSLVAAK